MSYIKDPKLIEKTSFEIITSEMKEDNFDEKTGLVVKRVIHTTADFEYADLLEFHGNPIETGIQALKDGSSIYADTSMIMSGVNKRVLSSLGGQVCNFVHDEDVVKEAKERKITRSMVSMEKACLDDRFKIFAIGNAPTALYKLKEQIKEGKVNPKLIIGVPVGFVGAAESKEIIRDLGIPYIIVRGRKGGSTVAVAIINAMLYMI